MTLLGKKDGYDASEGASYIHLAELLMKLGAQTDRDLKELWSRIVFSMLVKNTDDHLRNHGFILVPGKGWKLSPAYDLNPVASGSEFKLNVSESENAIDLDLALSVANIFRLTQGEANAIIQNQKSIVRQWRTLADRLEISRAEQSDMAPAFALAF